VLACRVKISDPVVLKSGEGGVPVLLDGLDTRALSDPVLKAVFGDYRVPRLKAHQYALITQEVGGPHQYSGRSLVATMAA
jgi:truncated hemoglobin YjbI